MSSPLYTSINEERDSTKNTRYYPSARDIFIVRLDPGVTDGYSEDEIITDLDVRPRLFGEQDELDSLERSLSPQGLAVLRGEDRAATLQTRIENLKAQLYNQPGQSPEVAIGSARWQKLSDRAALLGRAGGIFGSGSVRDAVLSGQVNLSGGLLRAKPRDQFTSYLDIAPLSTTRRINSYRQADELSVEFDWRTMPFDARAIRAILVLHYEGTVTADAWAGGIAERVPSDPTPTGYAVPASGEFLRFMGFADSIADGHSSSGDTVALQFRDLTSVLIDTQMPSGQEKRIYRGQPLTEAVRLLLSQHPTLSKLIQGPIIRLGEGEQEPVLDPGAYSRVSISPVARRKDPQAPKFSTRPTTKPTNAAGAESYWDAITDLCVSHGYHPILEFDTLVLVRPRTLYRDVTSGAFVQTESVYPRPGSLRDRLGHTDPIRSMVYGKNVEDLKRSRKLAKVKVPTIEIRSYDPNAQDPAKRVLKVRHPQRKRATKVDASGTLPNEEILVHTVHGISDIRILKSVAEQVYESIGRQELGVSVTTFDLASWIDLPGFDPNLDPDLLDVRTGDPFRILYSLPEQNAFDIASSFAKDLESMTFDSAPRFFESKGFSRQQARILSQVWGSRNIPTVFRLQAATISFSSDAGFQIDLELRDYLRARADIGASTTISQGVTTYKDGRPSALSSNMVDELLDKSLYDIASGVGSRKPLLDDGRKRRLTQSDLKDDIGRFGQEP